VSVQSGLGKSYLRLSAMCIVYPSQSGSDRCPLDLDKRSGSSISATMTRPVAPFSFWGRGPCVPITPSMSSSVAPGREKLPGLWPEVYGSNRVSAKPGNALKFGFSGTAVAKSDGEIITKAESSRVASLGSNYPEQAHTSSVVTPRSQSAASCPNSYRAAVPAAVSLFFPKFCGPPE
jgi:hypothetical protein